MNLPIDLRNDQLRAAATPPRQTAPPSNRDFSSPVPAPSADPFLKSKIAALQRKQRCDTFLSSLTDDQSLQLMDWMYTLENLSDVHRRVTAPPPEGFGVKVHLTTLRRLRDQFRAEDIARSAESMIDVITDLEKETDLNQSARVQTVINHLLHEKAFELSRTHPGSVVLKDVLTSIQKLSELDYKRQKLQLERERLLRHNTSPAPTQHHRVDLNIVPSNRNPAVESVVIHSEPHPETSSEPARPQLESLPPSS